MVEPIPSNLNAVGQHVTLFGSFPAEVCIGVEHLNGTTIAPQDLRTCTSPAVAAGDMVVRAQDNMVV